MAHELGCIVSRAREHVRWVIFCALVASGACAAWLIRIQPEFTSRIVMRARDEAAEAYGTPPSAHQLVQNLNNAALNRSALLRLMDDHDLYPSTRQKAPDLALEDLRDRIEVDVIQRDFPGEDEKLVRSTELSLSYTADDPELALKLVRAFATTIVEAETGVRQRAAENAVDSAAAAAAAARSELQSREVQEAELRRRLLGLKGEDRLATLLELERAQQAASAIAKDLGQLEEVSTVGSALLDQSESAQNSLGLHFEVLDRGQLAPPPRFTQVEKFALSFALAFLLTFPGFGALLGVLDSRVRNGAGLRRLGLQSFGHIPPFAGDHLGSWQARTSARNS